jgi:hypothetical protein
MSARYMYFHLPDQVYQRNVEEVWNGRLQARKYSHADQLQIEKDDISKDADQRLYRSMIGSLLYVTTSRPDVMQAVGQVANISSSTKGNTCYGSKENIQISQRNKRLWIMVSKRE